MVVANKEQASYENVRLGPDGILFRVNKRAQCNAMQEISNANALSHFTDGQPV